MPVFGQEENKKRPGVPVVAEIVGRVNDNTKRLRLLEDRERLLTSRIASMDESIYQKIKDIEESIKDINSRVAAQDEKINSMQNTVKEVVKQMKFLATKSEIKRLEETIKILSPIKLRPAETEAQGRQ
jgi:peptidoglycan hydrolase CwlO-like protein